MDNSDRDIIIIVHMQLSSFISLQRHVVLVRIRLLLWLIPVRAALEQKVGNNWSICQECLHVHFSLFVWNLALNFYNLSRTNSKEHSQGTLDSRDRSETSEC